MGGFHAFIEWRDQGNPDMVKAGVYAIAITGQVTAGQYGDVFLGKKPLREFGV